ncbi:cytochrome-c oxidase, cbb3-type subunit III [Neisseria leonii]|uniref:cytochrome-c oxidase, cbb3-type subunit III n=1 Tax=Neisseria leonii TaxID=2995413 RepID=UPI00237A259F|nr:cytochrome-c oxidase, cbb3-type subunit III [Neisseria sp. 3986]MDD9325572.1 cytochrome-c oxidase, cbb3-type subunit III [Neisseria sp. 3986]
MNTTQFTSSFWSYYIIAIVVLSFIGLFWLLFSQNKVKQPKKGEEVETMGHAWDGIEEYNNPLPKWWFYLFILTMLFAIGYLAAYPGLGDYKGFLNWTSANQYEKEVAEANDTYGPLYAKFAGMPVEEVARDPQALRIGKNLFDTYCIQCHASDGKGNRGFPNLTDNDWLWGGSPEKIRETIEKGRVGVMAAWGPVLGEERVRDVAHYVMSLSKPKEAYDADRAARGAAVFNGAPANCFTCHGDKGQGIQGLGPNLTDDIWLWGGSQKAIIETITNGRHNQMPAWNSFLDSDKLHLMTAYVWGLSNRDGGAAAKQEAPASGQASAPAADTARVSVENGVVKFYFATASNELAADAATVAADVVAAGKDGKKLIVSGFADSTGDAAANEVLSKERAQAVQAFLEAQGVPAANIELRKPENTTGAKGNDVEGRRVEVVIGS